MTVVTTGKNWCLPHFVYLEVVSKSRENFMPPLPRPWRLWFQGRPLWIWAGCHTERWCEITLGRNISLKMKHLLIFCIWHPFEKPATSRDSLGRCDTGEDFEPFWFLCHSTVIACEADLTSFKHFKILFVHAKWSKPPTLKWFIFFFLSFSHELTFPPAFLQLLIYSRALQAEVLLHCHDGKFYEAEWCFFFPFLLFGGFFFILFSIRIM